MATVVLAAYGAILWTIRRGFDWTDEAFVYTMIASNRRAIGEPWGFQHLLHPLYVLTGQSVLVFRVFRLAGYVLLSLALVWTARFVLRRLGILVPRLGWAFILLLAQAGTFLAWSYPPRYLGYNELSSWFSQLGVALILLSLAWGNSCGGSQKGSQVMWLIWAGLGSITMLLVFAKVTSGFAFASLLVLTALLPHRHLRLWKRFVGAVAGAVVVLLMLWATGSPLKFYAHNMVALMFDKSARKALGRPISRIITSHLDSLLLTGWVLLPALLIFTLLVLTLTGKAGGRRDAAVRAARGWPSYLLCVLLVISLVALPKVDAWSYLGELVGFIGGAAIIGLVILGADQARTRRPSLSLSRAVAVGGSAVVAAPFISSVGTSNPFAGEFLFAATLWAVALGVALVLLALRAQPVRGIVAAVPSFLVGFVVILLAAVAVKAAVVKPYHVAPLLTQETSTSVPALRGLLLTEADAAWIDWVAAAGDSLHADGVPATAIYSSGALFAFNHSGYAHPWVGSRWPLAFKSLSIACTKNPPADLLVLQPGDLHAGATAGVIKSLAKCGINFPGDFSVAAQKTFEAPKRAMTIWRLKSGWPVRR
ncbi:MAG: hypothetical protein QOE58_1320 [Actinomycetota bacterium]|nr:hypothetical protein [Actinomycetota bacterium]